MLERFGSGHYVPILRWKEAERGALAELYESDRKDLTPLVELVPESFIQKDAKGNIRKKETPSSVLSKVAGQIFKSWDSRQFFVDLQNLPKDVLGCGSTHCLTMLGEYASNLHLSLIPVTSLKRDEAYQSAVRTVLTKHNQGACVRLTVEDANDLSLKRRLFDILSFLGLTSEETDLLVDFEIVDTAAPEINRVLLSIPDLDRWRNFVVAAGAFPKDLAHLAKNQKHEVQRLDWARWKELAVSKSIGRIPIYGDYTIQHARYSRNPGQMHYSASIRYTADSYWVIMRGEDVFKENGLGFRQYPDWAMLLCDLPEFSGESYSEGDKYIKEMSQQSARTGAASTWLRAGINHHMTFTVRQLATLSCS